MTVGVNEVAQATSLVSQRTAIPFAIAPTGTMANNGAVTLGTALPAVYGSCYLYLPAGAISASSLANWYYAVMTSTTVGTVFNNLYVPTVNAGANPFAGGAPFIPAAPTAFVSTGPGAFTGSVLALTGPALFISSGTIGPNGFLRVCCLASVNNSAGVKTVTLGLGSIAAPATFVSIVPTTSSGQKITTTVFNRGASSINVADSASLYGPGASATGNAYTAINFAVANYLVPTLQLAVATDVLVLEALTYEPFNL